MNLGGVDIGTDFYQSARYGYSRVDSRMVLSRADTPMIWGQEAGPQTFDLVGGENYATLTGAQLEALYSLAKVVGAKYDLINNSTTILVVFRNWDQPVIEYEALGPREVMAGTDIYRNVKIKLMEA